MPKYRQRKASWQFPKQSGPLAHLSDGSGVNISAQADTCTQYVHKYNTTRQTPSRTPKDPSTTTRVSNMHNRSIGDATDTITIYDEPSTENCTDQSTGGATYQHCVTTAGTQHYQWRACVNGCWGVRGRTPSVNSPDCPPGSPPSTGSCGPRASLPPPTSGRTWRQPTWCCLQAAWCDWEACSRQGSQHPTVRCPCMTPGGCHAGWKEGGGGNSCGDLGTTSIIYSR